MARKKQQSMEITILPPGQREISKLVPTTLFENLPFWEKLNTNQKAELTEEGRQLGVAFSSLFKSALAIGQHLVKIRELLIPYNGAFTKFTRQFGLSGERKIYRYIDSYENAAKHLSPTIIDAAAARGMELFSSVKERPLGKYTDAYGILPAPKISEGDIESANRYLDQLEQTYIEHKVAHAGKPKPKFRPTASNQEDWQESLIRMFHVLFQRLPPASKSNARKDFVRTHVGMVLTEAGMSSGSGITAVAIPEEWQTGRGRPRIEKEEATA